MGGFVHRAQPLTADVSVPLGGGEVGVAQQLLHRPQVGAAVEEVGGEGVAQGVRVGGRGRPAVEDAPRVTRREATAAAVDEQGVDVGAAGDERAARPVEPRAAARRRPDR